MSKMQETTEVKIGENTFYIRPFGAFYSARISGEVGAFIVPITSIILPFLQTKSSVADMEVSEIAPALETVANNMSGEKVENLLKMLITNQGKIGFYDENGKATTLNDSNIDEIFCGNTQDLFVLAWHVIKLNFSGFFGKADNLFGKARELAMSAIQKAE